jgi:fatty-acyl-CoA synthase
MRINIGHWTTKNAAIHQDKVALISTGRQVSYRELDARVNRLADALGTRGLRRGDRVAALLFNGIEYLEALFACAKTGMILVPLNVRLSAGELVDILGDCTARALLYDPALGAQAAALEAGVSSLELLIRAPLLGPAAGPEGDAAHPLYQDLLDGADAADATAPGVGGEDTVLLMYTSGTTGRPKGVMLTHENCFFQVVNGWALGIGPDVVSLVVLPLFHVGGLGGSVTPILAVGGTAVLVPRFDPAEVLRLVEAHGVHGIMGVPTVHQMLIEHPDFETRDLSSLGVLISGGAPLPEALMQAFHARGLEMRQGYGLTEASPGVTGMGPGDARRKPASVGRPCLYTDVKIVDDQGREVPTGEVGELICRGPNVMKGYWNRPDATAEVLVDGWLHTGDLARFDGDGYVTIAGRKKEMIISGGENVYPGEVEQILTNHPDVALAAVVGRPDPRWGEVPVAFVIPQPGRTPEPADLVAYAAGRLAKYKVPQELHVAPALPMNAAGKILKNELVKRFQEEA